MAARSKALVCGRSLAGIVGSNPAKGMYVLSLVSVCSQVEVSATGRSLVQRTPNECVCVALSVIRLRKNERFRTCDQFISI